MTRKPKPIPLFPSGDDLPLFSGAPQPARIEPFAPVERPAQDKLPGLSLPPDYRRTNAGRSYYCRQCHQWNCAQHYAGVQEWFGMMTETKKEN